MSTEQRIELSDLQLKALGAFAQQMDAIAQQRWLYLSAVLEGQNIDRVLDWKLEGRELVVTLPQEADSGGDAPA